MATLVDGAVQPNSGALLKQLEQALSDRDTQQAQKVQNELLSSKPSLDVLLSAGGLLGEHEMLQNSADVFANCVAMYPESFEAHYDLAFALLNLGKPRQALTALSSARTAGTTEEAAAHYLRGKIDEAMGDMQGARENFVAANRARPREENYALDLALLYLRSYAYVPAIDVLQPASKYHPESRELKLELALADALAGRKASALELCGYLQADQTLSSPAFLIAAFAQCTSNNFETCSKQAQLGLAARNPHPYLYYLNASALWNLSPSNGNQALGNLNQAITHLPHCAACLELRSKILEAGGNDQQASADLEKVVQNNPQAASAWYRLAQLYKKLGRTQESTECLRRYQSIRTEQANQEVESFRQQFFSSKSVSN